VWCPRVEMVEHAKHKMTEMVLDQVPVTETALPAVHTLPIVRIRIRIRI
jgi:hypothetical protein